MKTVRHSITWLVLASVLPFAAISGHAQTVATASQRMAPAAKSLPILVAATEMVSSSSAELPDAPGTLVVPDALGSGHQPANSAAPTGTITARKMVKFIPPNAIAQPLTAGDKVKLSLFQLVAPVALMGDIVSAGYSHLSNSSPNYGTNSTAFAQRFGAAVARTSSQEVFTGAIMAPLLHMDPRYYVRGSEFSLKNRIVYAGTRVLVTRTDSGRRTINAPLLIGYAGAAALSNTYYPQINRNFKDTASEYGSSLGGAALGFLFDEFADDFLRAIHLRAN